MNITMLSPRTLLLTLLALALLIGALTPFNPSSTSATGNQEPTLPAIWVEVGNPAPGQNKIPYIRTNGDGSKELVPAGHGTTWEHFQTWSACPITGFMGLTADGKVKVKGGGISGSTDGVDVLLNRQVTNAATSYGPYTLDRKGGPHLLTNTPMGTLRDALDFMEARDGFPSNGSYARSQAMRRIYESGARAYSYTDAAYGAVLHNGVATFTIRLAKPSEHTVTVLYGTAFDQSTAQKASTASLDGYLMDGTHDYRPLSVLKAVFQPGETAKTFHVQIINDCVDDPGETVAVSLTREDADTGDPDLNTAWSALADAGHLTNHYVIQNHDTVILTSAQKAAKNLQPTVDSAIDDATIVSESGTHEVSLSGVFYDAENDTLTITAKSSDTAIATVAVATDQSSLTVTAKKRGTATITGTAADGNGGLVEDTFTVTVKAAPAVASAIADVSGLFIGDEREVCVSGVFSDADSDALTVTATSSSDAIVTVAAAADGSSVTLTAKSRGTATVTVTAQDTDGNRVSDAFDVTVVNRAPTVASATDDATIVNESGTSQASLSGVFSDADHDSLTITASSSDEKVATASVSTDQATLTVTAKARGTATITVTAKDGNGGSVEDAFTVTVKAAPVVASAIADVSELAVDATHEVSMSGVFSDADGDALTISATSSDSTVVQVSNTIDPSTGSATAITVIGAGEGTATITVTAQDSDGSSVSDAFDVTVPAAEQRQAVELPGPVSGLTVTASAENSVTVSWITPETGGAPQGYIVHLRPENGKQGSGTTKRPGADRTTVSFNNLESGRTYEVWVRAQNEAGKGERTHATITLPAVLPGPVTGLGLTATADTVTVSWSAPETGGAPDNYIVHISPEDGGKGKTKTPKAKKTQVTFENLEAGTAYEVWVRAKNGAGKGERVHASITLPEAGPPPEESQRDGQQ